MKKFRTPWNYKQGKDSIEKIDPVSVTVPGESRTIEELINRHSSGLMDPVHRTGYYDDEENHDNYDMEKLTHADMVDKDQVQQEQYERDVQNFEKRKKKQEAAKAAKERESESSNEEKKTDSSKKKNNVTENIQSQSHEPSPSDGAHENAD